MPARGICRDCIWNQDAAPPGMDRGGHTSLVLYAGHAPFPLNWEMRCRSSKDDYEIQHLDTSNVHANGAQSLKKQSCRLRMGRKEIGNTALCISEFIGRSSSPLRLFYYLMPSLSSTRFSPLTTLDCNTVTLRVVRRGTSL